MREVAVILQQIAIVFLLIGVGALMYRLKLLTKEGSKQLSNLIINVISPAVILIAYQTDYDPEHASGMLWTLLLTFVMYITAIPLSYLIVRNKPERETAIERFCTVYSNCGFMGIPLIQGIFGYEGVFYTCTVIAVFNMFIWTHGVSVMRGAFSFRILAKNILSPNIIAIVIGMICFFAKIKIPYIPKETISHFAGMNTPVAMLIAGVTIAQTDLKKMIMNKRIYMIALYKLIIVPAVCILIMSLFRAPGTAFCVVAITTACPSAGMSTILALKYDKNARYSSEIFAFSTLASAITLPLMVMLTQVVSQM